MSVQLGLDLQNLDPLSPRYLVVHSGIVDALNSMRAAVDEVNINPKKFIAIAVIGEKGSGKTHLLRLVKAEAEQKGLKSIRLYEFNLFDEEQISAYVASYEEAKAKGGLVIAALTEPSQGLINPHLGSRVSASQIVRLNKPKESELKEILISLLERSNFNLGEKAISYIISRVPASPLSFAAISDKLQEAFREHGKSAKFSVVKDLLG